ncbi:tRNA-dihydrouridine synthase [Trachipleistophora hominis]|uniref:tRNA-dihydrouridine(16/17) synthase [NAD(P)(+)] n=1 Tax=Trachipleistophora hominis TaxID=72359 RepID=L7JU94_TRAHO|nr:tRNA-dihydrouridine synthase [Trachipleistophora hominis]
MDDLFKNRPLMVLAPMYKNCGLAYRTLSRKYGTDLCYTEMVHTQKFLQTKNKKRWLDDFVDSPLIVQICGNDPCVMRKAAEYFTGALAIDVNFGCPQLIAKRGNYGAYLQDDWQLTSEILKSLSSLEQPVTCKIRIFDDDKRTIDYVRMIEMSGCKMLAVHGRTREQRGQNTGLANWNTIKLVKEHLTIPVISNGNILCRRDVIDCLNFTKCDGVMVAETHLYNPLIFSDVKKSSFEVLREYFDLCGEATPIYEIKSHTYKILHKAFDQYDIYKCKIQKAGTFWEIRGIVDELERLCDCELKILKPRIRHMIKH